MIYGRKSKDQKQKVNGGVFGVDYQFETEEEKYEYQNKILEQIKNNTMIEDMEKVKKVASAGIGQSFGELALLYNQNRQASVICEKITDFAIMEKKHYQSILSIFGILLQWSLRTRR